MTFLTNSSLIVKKTPLIQGKCDEEVIQMQPTPRQWTHRRSLTALFCTTMTAFLVTLFGITTGLMLYRQYIRTTAVQRYQRFCTIPITVKDPAFYEPNYRVMPLRWSTDPEVQVISTAPEDVTDDVVSSLREEFDIGDSVEKISVLDNGRQVSFIHDFDANVTGIMDSDRCFTMDLDPSVVVAPSVLVVSIAEGDMFDVSRVRAELRAALPALDSLATRAQDFLDHCRGKPTYNLMKEEGLVIRKRSADAPSHDYIQFSGKHVQEIEITNLADLLQHEQDIRKE